MLLATTTAAAMSHRSGLAGGQQGSHYGDAELTDSKSQRSPPRNRGQRRSPSRYDGRWPSERDYRGNGDVNGRGTSDTRSGERRRYEDSRSYRDDGDKHSRAEGSARLYRHRDDRQKQDDDAKRRRSMSPTPDFARDRARERDMYDRKHGSGTAQTFRSPPASGSAAATGSAEPDFKPSGLLAKESNSKNGVTLKYFEPPEARKPKKRWRLYVFKDGKEVDMIHISRQSCYLMGRDQAVADIPVEHVSVSKQHAVIQYRNITESNEYGDEKRTIKPFLIDLDSANGCNVNGKEVPPSRYYELKNGDTIKLGGSQREYVLLAEEA